MYCFHCFKEMAEVAQNRFKCPGCGHRMEQLVLFKHTKEKTPTSRRKKGVGKGDKKVH